MKPIDEIKQSLHYCMHGCGVYSGVVHGNSYDALNYWYRKGVKLFEIDMAKTADGEYVALAHGMTDLYLNRFEIMDLGDCDYTEQWFMRQKLNHISTKGLSTMNLKLILEFMKKHTDVFIIFDMCMLWFESEAEPFARSLKHIVNDNTELVERCMLEVYNQNMIDEIRNVNPSFNIMYCVHDNFAKSLECHDDISINSLKAQRIDFVSYPWMYVQNNQEEIKSYIDNGFFVMSLRKNNLCEKEMSLLGVKILNLDVVYTKWGLIYEYPLYIISRIKNLFFTKLIQKRNQ